MLTFHTDTEAVFEEKGDIKALLGAFVVCDTKFNHICPCFVATKQPDTVISYRSLPAQCSGAQLAQVRLAHNKLT